MSKLPFFQIYSCAGYCRYDLQIFVGDIPSYPERRGELITDKDPRELGWVLTNNREWSYDGKFVWLCPDCAARWEWEKIYGRT